MKSIKLKIHHLLRGCELSKIEKVFTLSINLLWYIQQSVLLHVSLEASDVNPHVNKNFYCWIAFYYYLLFNNVINSVTKNRMEKYLVSFYSHQRH